MIDRCRRILVIRRDNIGDLLCTTPVLSALRRHYPDARIACLVNAYNAPVLQGNPDLDRIYSYTKAKHAPGLPLAHWWREWRVYQRLRRERFDLVIHANPMPHRRTARLVRYLGGRWRLGVVDPARQADSEAYNIAVSPEEVQGTHHVERVYSLLRPLGIRDEPGPLVLKVQGKPSSEGDTPILGVHISSRKPCNRWPEPHFARLIEGLLAEKREVRLFWAPGSQNNPHHPGDDEMAERLAAHFTAGLVPCETHTLEALIQGIAGTDGVICADGGALHIAVALGKPVVGLYGCTDPAVWGPWQVRSQALRGNGDAASIDPARVLAAAREVMP